MHMDTTILTDTDTEHIIGLDVSRSAYKMNSHWWVALSGSWMEEIRDSTRTWLFWTGWSLVRFSVTGMTIKTQVYRNIAGTDWRIDDSWNLCQVSNTKIKLGIAPTKDISCWEIWSSYFSICRIYTLSTLMNLSRESLNKSTFWRVSRMHRDNKISTQCDAVASWVG